MSIDEWDLCADDSAQEVWAQIQLKKLDCFIRTTFLEC